MLVKISFSWRNEKACNCFRLVSLERISAASRGSKFCRRRNFSCFAMILVRRKLYNKMQLNIQYTVYQLSERVDKREESQETGWFCTSCYNVLNWCRGYSIVTFRLKGSKGTVRTAGRESSIPTFANNLF